MTPAVVAAQRAKVPFRILEYSHDPDAASYGLEAAEKLGLDPARVFKTLVAGIDGKPAVALVPVARTLDLKALAGIAGGKRGAMIEVAEAERLTGYVAGGISPLGQRKRLPTFVDGSALSGETIYVSAGRRGLQMALTPEDLIRLCHARLGAIAR